MSEDEKTTGRQPRTDIDLERQRTALREIRTVGDPVLRDPAKPVVSFDRALKELSQRMIRIMHDAPGIGLAAPQIGVTRRVIVYDVERPVTLVNPEIVSHAEETETIDEGCLSVPEAVVAVERPVSIRVRGRDLRGREVEYDAHELEARVIQHELDHLDGILILERTSREERARALGGLRRREPAQPAS
jgi:peptide deformylase